MKLNYLVLLFVICDDWRTRFFSTLNGWQYNNISIQLQQSNWITQFEIPQVSKCSILFALNEHSLVIIVYKSQINVRKCAGNLKIARVWWTCLFIRLSVYDFCVSNHMKFGAARSKIIIDIIIVSFHFIQSARKPHIYMFVSEPL